MAIEVTMGKTGMEVILMMGREVVLLMAIKVTMGKTGMKVVLSMAIEITMRKGMEVILVMAIKVTMRITMKVIMGTTMEVIKEMTMGTSMKSMSRGMDRDVARGSIGSTIFFLILVLVNFIRSGSRLTVHDSVGVSTGFVN
jgi:hypothetical protein